MILLNIGIKENDIRNIIFLYEQKPLIDIQKQIKMEFNQHKLKLHNLFKNNHIINFVNMDNNTESLSLITDIHNLKNIFSVIQTDSVFQLSIENKKLNILNEQSNFVIPINFEDDFPELSLNITYEPLIDLHYYYDDIKNILIKDSSNYLSEYLIIQVSKDKLFILSTDNKRLHTLSMANPSTIEDLVVAIPTYFIDVIGKYKLSLSYINKQYVLHNNSSYIFMANHNIEKESKRAFSLLAKLSKEEYVNSFKVNKKFFLEELKKHNILSQYIYVHIKPNEVILYSNDNEKVSNEIKTISHAYDIHFTEHHGFYLHTKYLIDFIKAHNENTIEVFLSAKNLIYTKNNVCTTIRT